MSVMKVELPADTARPFTVDDLDAFPYDGRRYEIHDGALVVTPSPNLLHQLAITRLGVRLESARAEGMLVAVGPVDVVVSPTRVFAPDLLVVSAGVDRRRKLTEMPLLVVEVRSPSTAIFDVNVKRQVYAEAGIPSYWIVDPDRPSVTVYELRGDDYAEVARGEGDRVVEITTPFPVTLVPADLVRVG